MYNGDEQNKEPLTGFGGHLMNEKSRKIIHTY